MDDLACAAQALQTRYPGALTARAVASVASTNTCLLDEARAAAPVLPQLLVAAHQSAGRGRMGRRWQSAQAQDGAGALCFSLALPRTPPTWGLSLAVGVAVAEALYPQLHVKWPNDLWLPLAAEAAARWGKVGGILIETVGAAGSPEAPTLVIGVGLNLLHAPALDTDPPAVALAAVAGAATPTRAQALTLLVPAILAACADFGRTGWSPAWERRYAARDALRNAQVRVTAPLDGGSLTVGRVLGLGPQGELRIDTDAGVVLAHSGDVTVRLR